MNHGNEVGGGVMGLGVEDWWVYGVGCGGFMVSLWGWVWRIHGEFMGLGVEDSW